jgi:hypothetical protein
MVIPLRPLASGYRVVSPSSAPREVMDMRQYLLLLEMDLPALDNGPP